MNTAIVQSLVEMAPLRDDWNSLSATSGNPLLDFDWHYCCAQFLHSNDEPHIVVQYDKDDRVAGIAPLVHMQRRNGNWLEFFGAEALYEPAGIVYSSDAALPSMYKAIAASPIPVLLRRIPVHPDRKDASPQRRYQTGLWVQTQSAGTGILELDSLRVPFYETLSSKRKYDHRRSIKRAAEHGSLRFESPELTSENIDILLATAFDVENCSWKGKQGSSVLKQSHLHTFFREYCMSVVSQGTLRIFFIYLNDRPVAMALCLQKYGALWFLKIGYNDAFSKCSPGMLLLMSIIEYCQSNGISRIEHLGTFEPWLAPVTTYVRQHSTHIHYPLNVAGLRLIAADAFRVAKSRFATPPRNRNRSSNA